MIQQSIEHKIEAVIYIMTQNLKYEVENRTLEKRS